MPLRKMLRRLSLYMRSILFAEKQRVTALLLIILYGLILLLAMAAEGMKAHFMANQWGWDPLAWIVLLPIAALQNHLHVLAHEGAHFHLHKKRRWNDFLANMFCALPFLGLIRPYRYFHFLHHRHLLDPQRDPEIGFYAEQGYHYQALSRSGWCKLLLLDLCGFHFVQFSLSYNFYLWKEWRSGKLAGLHRSEIWAITLVLLLFLGAIFRFGVGNVLFYWFLPQATILFLLLKIQGYGEHSARGGSIEDSTNSYHASWLIRFFVYPLNANLHREHHLAAYKPWFELAASGRRSNGVCRVLLSKYS